MSFRWFGHFCLSAILFIGIVFPSAPRASAQQLTPQSTSPAAVEQRQNPPEEKIVPTDRGLEKLAPDLRQLLKDTGGSLSTTALNVEPAEPLLVSALVHPGTDLGRFFQESAASRVVSGFQWVTGKIQVAQLRKLVSVPDVLSVTSINTYQTAEAPGLDQLRQKSPIMSVKEMRQLLKKGGMPSVLQRAQQIKDSLSRQPMPDRPALNAGPAVSGAESGESAAIPGILDVHDVRTAREQGYKGKGVVVALVDTGVDFANPDLMGTQALVSSTGPYKDWPFAYDALSGALYAIDPTNTIGPENVWDLFGLTQYVHTIPVPNADCDPNSCGANLVLSSDSNVKKEFHFTWPNTSKSGVYRYSLLPDYALPMVHYYLGTGYPGGAIYQSPVIVSDEKQAGVYDTAYTDINYNLNLGDPGEKMTRDQPVGGIDVNKDGVWDFSGGMLSWISDGLHQPPGVAALYPEVAKYPIPASGELLAFINDAGGHGTNCASQIAGQGHMTDPQGEGPVNPLYAGGQAVGGVGGAVIDSMAPEAKIAAFENGLTLPLDAWALAVLGFDGVANTGDEANIVSNSWGDSQEVADGWDPLSRYAQQLSYNEAQHITFLVATGNGGHGYGTVTAPGGGSIIDVGASTAYGNMLAFEKVKPDQFLYGEVQPWSNRGPGAAGDIAPDIVAVGAWGLAADPLNFHTGDGESAYEVFGGTSMSTPVSAGVMAMVYQSFRETHGGWPGWDEARGFLLGTAQDLGYDVLVQGAGNIQATRAVNAAKDLLETVSPQQWHPGGYRGESYPDFPAVLAPLQSDQKKFTISNPALTSLTADLSSSVLKNVHDETFSFAFSPPAPNSKYELPVFLENLSGLIDQYHPDMLRAQVILPYAVFDKSADYYVDNTWAVYFYDWLDRNGNGKLWSDTNRDGMVEEGEIDVDPETGLSEFNRFTYGYPQGTVLEASLGQAGLEKLKEHNGIFLGLNCGYCFDSVTLTVRLSFYQKVPWDWLNLSANTLQVPAKGTGSFTATFTVPPGTPPGSYEGAVSVHMGGRDRVLPVLAIVAASSTTFNFGGPGSYLSPYDNNHLFGGFNWGWHQDAGDWRFFYYDLPEGTASPGKKMVIDTSWSDPRTDVDTWAFRPSKDPNSGLDPKIFGPQGLQMIGGSADTLITAGKYLWKTDTGYSREIVGLPTADGLGMIALHNVLNGGSIFGETVTGKAYQVSSDPEQVDITSAPVFDPKPYLSGSQKISLTATANIDEGMAAQAFGLSPVVNLTGQTVIQNKDYDLCNSNWVYKLNQRGLQIKHGGVLEITTSAAGEKPDPALDLDLYLSEDDGDGVYNCAKDRILTYSLGSTADEKIKIYYPEDGVYWVIVHGTNVPKGQQPFNIQIRAIQGTGLNLRNVPVGPVAANQPVEITASFNSLYPDNADQGLEGVLLAGPPVDPSLIEVPIRVKPDILLYPQPAFSSGLYWLSSSPVKFDLSFQNRGIESENGQAQIQIPEGVIYEPGSASASGGLPVVYDTLARTLNWSGPVGAGEKITVSFQATSQPGFPMTRADLFAQVSGEKSGQSWPVKTAVWINAYSLFFPRIRR